MRLERWVWTRLYRSLEANGKNSDFIFISYFGKFQMYTKPERIIFLSPIYSMLLPNNYQFMLKPFSLSPFLFFSNTSDRFIAISRHFYVNISVSLKARNSS